MDYIPPDVNHGHRATVGAIVMLVLTTVTVALRFLSRYLSPGTGFWWDDWCALVISTAMFGFSFHIVNEGLGRHVFYLTEYQVENVLLDFYILEILYDIGLTFVKMSVILFYVRIFKLQKLWFKITVAFVGFCAIGWGIGVTLLGALQCTPQRKAWHPFMKGHCLSPYTMYLGVAIPNVVIDFFILLLPVPFLQVLHTTKRRKFGLLAMFAMGYCTLGLSLARLIVVTKLSPVKIGDFTWNLLTMAILGALEVGIGLVSVCLPSQIYLVKLIGKHIHIPTRKPSDPNSTEKPRMSSLRSRSWRMSIFRKGGTSP